MSYLRVPMAVLTFALGSVSAEASTFHNIVIGTYYQNSAPQIVSEFDFPDIPGETVRLNITNGWIEPGAGVYFQPDYRIAYWYEGSYPYTAIVEFQRPISPGVWPGLPISEPDAGPLPSPFAFRQKGYSDMSGWQYSARPFYAILADSDTIRLTVVPEPSTFGLAAVAIMACAIVCWKRSRSLAVLAEVACAEPAQAG